jgi:ABC-type Na+ efflux pump permease subunit
MNLRSMYLIARKDMVEVSRNKTAVLPMFILPLIFVIVLPAVMIFAIQSSADTAQTMTADPDIQSFLENMPLALSAIVEGLTMQQSSIVLMLGMMLAPMFLILPLMFSSIIAAESFAGEFERKTMEALLYTPASDKELFFGKVLAAFVPSILITWLSFLVYIVVLNGMSFPLFQRIWFPLASWWPLIFWVSPALSMMSIAVTVLISARVKNFMGTYQLSGSLVLVVMALLIAQVSGVVYLDVTVGIIIGLVCWTVTAVILRFALKLFDRQKLLLDV